jgi:hypothetical protein
VSGAVASNRQVPLQPMRRFVRETIFEIAVVVLAGLGRDDHDTIDLGLLQEM